MRVFGKPLPSVHLAGRSGCWNGNTICGTTVPPNGLTTDKTQVSCLSCIRKMEKQKK